ncbi:MAG TPA: hypothetical protein VHY30_07485 [Verrucomicrobiae bacterium]|jgi:hypothetical protein|nr:hypothetical protein [Verrucomicrobiae bacterium]
MKKLFVTLAIASLSVLSVVRAATIAENFSADPALDGWQIFGNTNQFQWDSTNQNLDVTWDSTQPNSYFYHPLGTMLTRNDDFSIAFDLRLNDIASGNEPGKTGPLQLGFGFLNFNPLNLMNATNANFMRGSFGNAPDVAEFDYYPHGFYTDPFFDSPAAPVPSFISDDGFDYAPANISVFDDEMPTNQLIHVTYTYTASNQTAVIFLTTNGVSVGEFPPLILNGDNGFADADDNFVVDTFSVSSYSSVGDDFDSVLAHGSVGNIVVTLPPPAQNLSGAFSNGVWQIQFTDRSGWLYTLERTTNFISWTAVSIPTSGNGTNLFLQDTNQPGDKAFYRISAQRP